MHGGVDSEQGAAEGGGRARLAPSCRPKTAAPVRAAGASVAGAAMLAAGAHAAIQQSCGAPGTLEFLAGSATLAIN